VEIIPAIDLLGGRCVRLYQGDFERVTTYEADPHDLARRYRDAGASRLHVVDLDGARTGVAANHEIIRRLAAESGLAVQAGGGVRTLAALEAWLEAGAERVVIGSVAAKDPATATSWLQAVGPERMVLGLDVRLDPVSGQPEASAYGWQEGSGRRLWELVALFAEAGARYVLCTDIGRDGTLAGPNCGLYTDAIRRFPEIRWIASGGLGSAADLPALAATGVDAIVTGKALLDGRLTLEEIRQFSRAG
jgi:phosphoribosylformimino-5-aminoimidazole carboxamide ribotide isomerase